MAETNFFTWGGWGFVAVIVTALLAVLSFWYNEIKTQLDDRKDRERIRLMLEDKTTAFQRYQSILKTFGNRADLWFGPAISLKAFDRCLLLAFSYPIVLFVLAWLVGMPGTIGAIELLPEFEFWERLGTVVIVASVYIGQYYYYKTEIPKKFSDRITNLFFKNMAEAKGKVLWSDKVVESIAVVIVVAGSVSFVVIGVSFGSVFVVGAVAIAVFGIGVVVGVVVGVVAVAFAVAGAVAFGFNGSDAAGVVIVFVFYCILPIVNAVIDFCSWGFTRWLLSIADHGEEGWRGFCRVLLAVLADLVFAVLCLLGLTAIAALTLEAFNLFAASFGWPEFDWRSQISLARAYPFTLGLFVTGMLVSTLLPTIIHLTLGLGHAFTVWTPSAKKTSALISDDMSTSAKQKVAVVMVCRWLWYIPAFSLVLGMLFGLINLFSTYIEPFGALLEWVAFGSAALLH